MVELGFEKTVGLLERFDFKGLPGACLFERFDETDTAGGEPTTRFIIL